MSRSPKWFLALGLPITILQAFLTCPVLAYCRGGRISDNDQKHAILRQPNFKFQLSKLCWTKDKSNVSVTVILRCQMGLIFQWLGEHFLTLRHCHEKRLLLSLCRSICPHHHRGSHWKKLRKIWYSVLLWKLVQIFQICLRSDTNIEHFTWRSNKVLLLLVRLNRPDRVKWHQVVGSTEEVQILRERVVVLRYTYVAHLVNFALRLHSKVYTPDVLFANMTGNKFAHSSKRKKLKTDIKSWQFEGHIISDKSIQRYAHKISSEEIFLIKY